MFVRRGESGLLLPQPGIQVARVMPGGLPAAGGDLLNESFEGTGYENTWGETIGNGSVDEDSTAETPPTGGGTQVLECIQATTDFDAMAKHTLASSQTATWTRFYYKITAEGMGSFDSIRIVQFENTGGPTAAWIVRVRDDGSGLDHHIQIFDNGSLQTQTSSADITLDQWYKHEVKYDTDGGAWEWLIDDGDFHSDGAALTGSLVTDAQAIKLGTDASNFSCTHYFDLVAMDTSDYP